MIYVQRNILDNITRSYKKNDIGIKPNLTKNENMSTLSKSDTSA